MRTAFLRSTAIALALFGSFGWAGAQPTDPTGHTSNSRSGGHPNSDQVVDTPQQLSPNSARSDGEGSKADGEVIGATAETMPAKFSADNAAKDKIPLAVQDLELTAAQKQSLLQMLNGEPVATTGSAGTEVPPQPGAVLSEGFDLREFPIAAVEAAPALRTYKYVKLQDRVFVVQPANRVVVAEITSGGAAPEPGAVR
jgi:hypothetical protein